jgi:hypothetical protein
MPTFQIRGKFGNEDIGVALYEGPSAEHVLGQFMAHKLTAASRFCRDVEMYGSNGSTTVRIGGVVYRAVERRLT